ncbi:hypothetical protein SAMN05192552_103758 [Natrinema hispanicum]|uniref:Uncharacterized protein n=1 Tax=Natrinema hispanicum TaxID=392421 RepID=A0A1I0J041_9EURY|nr:hypothetical protein BDK88_3613 [Natrinema hispanicum]SDD65758.1 hypothetical protein SAMN05192552_103758 [Natrinema hispanicum]SEU02994.1 hypothetical protein SAMN04488694_1297 [Natrinema hispanicum]
MASLDIELGERLLTVKSSEGVELAISEHTVA